MRLGLELGTTVVRVARDKKGVILQEASVIADDPTLPEVYTVGNEARAMEGRTPDHVRALRPLQAGCVAAPIAAREMLLLLFGRALGWRKKLKPFVRVAVPVTVTKFEQEALVEALTYAGAGKVEPVPKPIAAAFGIDAEVGAPLAAMVVDLGGGTTEVAAISPGIVVCDAVGVGGVDLDRAITAHLRTAHGLEISPEMAEKIKIEVGSAWSGEGPETFQAAGRELRTLLPLRVEVSAEEIRQAMQGPLERMVDLVRRTLDRTPPSLSEDVLRRGVVLTGGGAQLRGMDRFMSERLGLEVKIAPDPTGCVARGLLLARLGIN